MYQAACYSFEHLQALVVRGSVAGRRVAGALLAPALQHLHTGNCQPLWPSFFTDQARSTELTVLLNCISRMMAVL